MLLAQLQRMLSIVFIHDYRRRDADIEAFHIANQWNRETVHIREILLVELQAEFFITEDEGTFSW